MNKTYTTNTLQNNIARKSRSVFRTHKSAAATFIALVIAATFIGLAERVFTGASLRNIFTKQNKHVDPARYSCSVWLGYSTDPLDHI